MLNISQSIIVQGTNSLNGATISSSYLDSDSVLTIRINASMSESYSITCNKGKTCRIDCQVIGSCDKLNLNCHDDSICYVKCNEDEENGIICPIGGYFTWITHEPTQPSKIPTFIPTEMPTAIGTSVSSSPIATKNITNTAAMTVATSTTSIISSTTSTLDSGDSDNSNNNSSDSDNDNTTAIIICVTIVLVVFIIVVFIYGYIRLKLKYEIGGSNNNNINGNINSNNELAVLNDDDSSKLNDLVATPPKIKQTGDNNGDAVHRSVQF